MVAGDGHRLWRWGERPVDRTAPASGGPEPMTELVMQTQRRRRGHPSWNMRNKVARRLQRAKNHNLQTHMGQHTLNTRGVKLNREAHGESILF